MFSGMPERYFVQHIQDGRAPGAYMSTLESAVERANLLWRNGPNCRQVIKDTQSGESWWRRSNDPTWRPVEESAAHLTKS